VIQKKPEDGDWVGLWNIE